MARGPPADRARAAPGPAGAAPARRPWSERVLPFLLLLLLLLPLLLAARAGAAPDPVTIATGNDAGWPDVRGLDARRLAGGADRRLGSRPRFGSPRIRRTRTASAWPSAT